MMSGVYEHQNIPYYVLSSSDDISLSCSDSALPAASHCQMVASYDTPIVVLSVTPIIPPCLICDSRTMAYID